MKKDLSWFDDLLVYTKRTIDSNKPKNTSARSEKLFHRKVKKVLLIEF